MASYFRFRRPYIRWTGYFKYGHFAKTNRQTPTNSRTYGKRITIDPITRIEATFASTSKWTTTQSAMHGFVHHVARIERFCADATHVTPGCSPSVSAASAPRCMPWPVSRVEDALKLEIPLNASTSAISS